MTVRRPNILSILRQESGSVAVLATAALLARIMFAALGLSAMPSDAFAGQILCTNAGYATAPVHGAPSKIDDCPCSHACPHSGTAALPEGNSDRLADGFFPPTLVRMAPAHDFAPALDLSRPQGLIRAPPISFS